MRKEARAFVEEAAQCPRIGSEPLPEDAMADDALAHLAHLYQVADRISMEAAITYRCVLAIIAVASTLLTLAFLLYDEAEMWPMIMVVGFMLACEVMATRFAARSRCHERYVKMRVLAECLRVEGYVHYAGCATRVSELLPWSLRHDVGWLYDILRSWEESAPAPEVARDVRTCWIEGQRAYHANAIAHASHRFELSQRVVRAAVAASVALYIFTLLFELACGGWAMPVLVRVADIGLWRAGLKIVLGTASAATIFVGGYVDKLSLGRVLDDHCKMEQLYHTALDRAEYECEEQRGTFLLDLAREELAENANWFAYQQANEAELTL